MSDAGDEIQVDAEVKAPVVEAAPKSKKTLEEALQGVLKHALVENQLARGLRECAKALDKHTAHLCVLAESCNEPEYIKLIEALCAEGKTPLIKVAEAKTLGQWVGLCKIDKEGNARKVVGCACVVVKQLVKEDNDDAWQVVEEYIKSR